MHINKGFLSRKSLYLDTRKQWKKWIDNVLNLADDTNLYEEWLEVHDGKGNLLMNANPIYSVIKKDKSKALRINQEEPRSGKPYMNSWTSVFDKGDGGENIEYLSISLELSNITQMESLKLIEKWFANADKHAFKHILETSNKKFEKNYVKSDIEKALELYEQLDSIKNIGAKISVGRSSRPTFDKEVIHRFGTIYTLHNSWDRTYGVLMSNLNKDLAHSIYTVVSAFSGLITDSGHIKYPNKLTVNRISLVRNELNHFHGRLFVTLIQEMAKRIEEVNEDLYEEIERKLEKSSSH